jgi:hypothetical protein
MLGGAASVSNRSSSFGMRLHTQASNTAGSGGLAAAGSWTCASASVVNSALDEPGVASCATVGVTPPSSSGRTRSRANDRSHGRDMENPLTPDQSVERHPTGSGDELSLCG